MMYLLLWIDAEFIMKSIKTNTHTTLVTTNFRIIYKGNTSIIRLTEEIVDDGNKINEAADKANKVLRLTEHIR